jgi:hypothetical protein
MTRTLKTVKREPWHRETDCYQWSTMYCVVVAPSAPEAKANGFGFPDGFQFKPGPTRSFALSPEAILGSLRRII